MSLDAIDLVLATEREFDIQISDNDLHAANPSTVAQYANLIGSKIRARGGEAPDEDTIIAKIISILVKEYDFSVGQVTRDSRFVEDLGF